MLLTERGREDREIINSLAVIIKTAHIHQPDNIAVVNAIKKFLTALISTDSGSSFETLYAALEEIETINIEKLKKTGQEESKLSRKKAIKKTYFSAVFLTKEIATKMQSGEQVT